MTKCSLEKALEKYQREAAMSIRIPIYLAFSEEVVENIDSDDSFIEKQAIKTSKETKRRKTTDNMRKIQAYLEQYGETKTNDIAAYIKLSPSRTRAILSEMENIEVIGTTTNRKYKLKKENEKEKFYKLDFAMINQFTQVKY